MWVGPAKPTSFDPPTPGFYDSGEVGECEVIATGSPRPCLRPFARTYYAVINCTYSCILDPVAEETWSRVKARY